MDIFKLLPKTNCRECGYMTCLAFAMGMAEGKTDLSACPYASDEAKKVLTKLEQPPVRLVKIGVGERESTIGGEKVAFRHEKKFENPTGFAMLLVDTMDDAEIDSRLQRFQEFQYKWVGILLRAELIAIKSESGDPRRYAELVAKVKKDSDANIILVSEDPDILAAGLEIFGDRKPLLHAATADNVERVASLAKQYKCPVAARAPRLEQLAALTGKLEQLDVHDIVLGTAPASVGQAFEQQVSIRDAAIYNQSQSLGFPTIVFTGDLTGDPSMEVMLASVLVAKYAGIVVLSDLRGEALFPLLLHRMGMFGDPQKEMTAPEGVYEIGEPDENSPVLLTSNWALSFLKITSAIEEAGVPAFVCATCLSEGVDIMCWCDYCLCSSQRGDFKREGIAEFFKKHEVEHRVKHKKLIMPGKSAEFQSEVEQVLPGLEIIVGPTRENMLVSFLRRLAAGSQTSN